jgi:predicted metal-binding transcription factor (methanogenesis marker protein 9)
MSFQTSNEVKQYIYQVFGKDIEIRDATFPLRLQPTPDDKDGADPHDPSNCFFVHTVRRMYGSQVVIFWKSVAYIDMVDGDGIRRVYRFFVTKDGTARLSRFDHGEPFPLGSAVTLQPPTKGSTLKANKTRRDVKKKQYVDRRKQLQTNLKRAATKLEQEKQRLAAAMNNEKQDAKKLAVITKQKEMAEASVKQVQADLAHMDVAKDKRAPKKFDLTTRNGAIGNYRFSGLSTPT